jgi:signal transduction histidine kinase
MLKGYRRRFVFFYMILIGAVLLIAFTSLDIFLYKNNYYELKNTMGHMLAPLDEPNNNFHQLKNNHPPKKEADDVNKDINRDEIITVFYDEKSDEISILDNSTSIDSNKIDGAVKEIVTLNSDYGTLSNYNLIYYREGMGNRYKITLTQTSYLTNRLIQNSLILLLIFVLSMGVFFVISLWLSKIAAKPMEDAIDMERQFVADISHDLKTPITVILANNSILKENPDAKISEESQWIDSTDNAAKNMMGMINEMLTLSNLESADKKIIKEKTDFSAIVQKAVLQLESVAYDRNIVLESGIDDDIFVVANREYLDRISNCLLENALKYEPDGGRVDVTLKVIKKKVCFIVKNEKSVISEQDLPHIFERFYRGDKARSIQKGHGLGLPIIKQMIDDLGGKIEVKSDDNNGTEFKVTLNLTE